MDTIESEISASDSKDPKTNRTFAYPDIKATVKLFFVVLGYMVAIGIIAGILLIIIDELNYKVTALKPMLNLLIYVSSMLLIIRYALRKNKKQQGYDFRINFNKIQTWLIPVVIISSLALIIPLSQAANLIPMPKSVQKFFNDAFTTNIFSIITATIAAPILEEILCRGIILNGLLKNYTPYKAILISAIFFGAIHLNPWQAIPAFMNGLFLGWIYYKTQSVIPGMIVHATINSCATIFLVFPSQLQNLPHFLGITYYIIAFLVSVSVFVATCIIINKKVFATPPIFHELSN